MVVQNLFKGVNGSVLEGQPYRRKVYNDLKDFVPCSYERFPNVNLQGKSCMISLNVVCN